MCLNDKGTPTGSPFGPYLKQLMKAYPGLPNMLDTLMSMEVAYKRMTVAEQLYLHDQASEDNGQCTATDATSFKPKYTKLTRIDRAVDRLVTHVSAKYTYKELCGMGQMVAFCLIPVCRFQEKHNLNPNKVCKAVELIRHLENPAMLISYTPSTDNGVPEWGNRPLSPTACEYAESLCSTL